MKRVVFDLGTNIDREASLAKALELLDEKVRLLRASSVYNSAPVGMANQPDFLNVSLEVETDLQVEDLRRLAREIEDAMGRNRHAPKFGPRIIDIDILLYDDLVDPSLNIPHEQTQTQLFVVLPLAELYPEGRHPESGLLWAELRQTLLRGRTARDAGIERVGGVDGLPLGPRAQSRLLQATPAKGDESLTG